MLHKTRISLSLCTALLLAACTQAPEPSVELNSIEEAGQSNSYQLLTVTENSKRWWHNAVFYEIWPRSFYDSDGDGTGDFNGMTQKLDYLNELGVNGIWLTPVFEAPSYHGYDFQDFYNVESDYGSMEDFEAFITAAHKKDIKVILDLVINHISDGHEWFKKSEAKEPGFEDFFIWRKEMPARWGKAWSDDVDDPKAVWHWSEQRQEYYYAAFSATQPDVNLNNPRVVEEMNKMASFWLEKGVDGFRLDAVRYVIEDISPDGEDADQADTDGTIAYWHQFTQHVQSINPEAMLVAEAWSDMATIGKYYDNGEGLQSAFDFDFGYVVSGILNAGGKRTADFGSVDENKTDTSRDALWANLQSRVANAPMSFYAPFLSNHDQNRIMHTLGDDTNKAKIAASLLVTSPGTLYLYYGEEIGISQATTGDDRYRRAIMQWHNDDTAGFNNTGEFWVDQPKWFSWIENHEAWWGPYWQKIRKTKMASVAEQQLSPDSLFNHYKRLLAVRNGSEAIQFPLEVRYHPVDNENIWLVEFIRNAERRVIIVNLSSQQRATFTVPKSIRGSYKDLLTGQQIDLSEQLSLAVGETHIL